MKATSSRHLLMPLLALAPALVFGIIATVLHISSQQKSRSAFMEKQAHLLAAAVDLRIERLLNLTRFCASSPSITLRMDPAMFEESCGRYAEMLGGWVVVIALSETHRHVINTHPNAPSTLASYPRREELPNLLEIEKRSRASGHPELANVFTGKIYTGGIVSAGQWLRLSDGREAMLYVGVPGLARF